VLFGSENAKAVAVISECESLWMVDQVDGEDVTGEGAVDGRCIIARESENASNRESCTFLSSRLTLD
jgi:hypothetical protein